MKKQTKLTIFSPGNPRFICALLIIIGFIVLALASCKVIKGKKTASTDSTTVTNANASQIKSGEKISKDSNTYTKETYYYGGDTTIINTFPVRIIREKGTTTNETKTNWRDSFYAELARIEALHKQESVKDKETKPDTLLLMIIAALILIILGLLYKKGI